MESLLADRSSLSDPLWLWTRHRPTFLAVAGKGYE